MTIDFPYLLEPKFLTVEQSARFLNVTTDIVLSLVEGGNLFAYVAIPAVPMVIIPSGHEDTMHRIISNPENFPEFDLEKATIIQSGIFRASTSAIKSVAIKGNSIIDSVWSLTLHDRGHDISESDERWLESNYFRLKYPVEITPSAIRLSMRLIKLHGELADLDRKANIARKNYSGESNMLKENPLHQSERRTLLNIIRALAELSEIKPIKTRATGDGWRKAAEALLKELADKGIAPPCKEAQTLAEKLREAFSLRE